MSGGFDLPEGYEQLPDNLLKTIIRVAEDNQRHMRTLDIFEMEMAKRGQLMAFGSTVIFGTITLWVTLTGHDFVGGTIGGTTIVAIVTAFISGRRLSRHA